MRMNWKHSSRPSAAAGLTLIEVMAALAILGTILAGVILAKARHTRQIAETEARRAAVEAADRLLTDWWDAEGTVPAGARGSVRGQAGAAGHRFAWRTRRVPGTALPAWEGRVVRLELRRAGEAGDQDASGVGEPLVTVEVVVRAEAGDAAGGEGS